MQFSSAPGGRENLENRFLYQESRPTPRPERDRGLLYPTTETQRHKEEKRFTTKAQRHKVNRIKINNTKVNIVEIML